MALQHWAMSNWAAISQNTSVALIWSLMLIWLFLRAPSPSAFFDLSLAFAWLWHSNWQLVIYNVMLRTWRPQDERQQILAPSLFTLLKIWLSHVPCFIVFKFWNFKYYLEKIDLGHLMVSYHGFLLILVQAALTQDLDSVKLQVEDLQREKVTADSLSRSISFPWGKVHLKLSFAFPFRKYSPWSLEGFMKN